MNLFNFFTVISDIGILNISEYLAEVINLLNLIFFISIYSIEIEVHLKSLLNLITIILITLTLSGCDLFSGEEVTKPTTDTTDSDSRNDEEVPVDTGTGSDAGGDTSGSDSTSDGSEDGADTDDGDGTEETGEGEGSSEGEESDGDEDSGDGESASEDEETDGEEDSGDEGEGSEEESEDSAEAANTRYNSAIAVLTSKCSNCHMHSGWGDYTTEADWRTSGYIIDGDANNSHIVKRIHGCGDIDTGNQMPKNAPLLSEADCQKVLDWINGIE